MKQMRFKNIKRTSIQEIFIIIDVYFLPYFLYFVDKNMANLINSFHEDLILPQEMPYFLW